MLSLICGLLVRQVKILVCTLNFSLIREILCCFHFGSMIFGNNSNQTLIQTVVEKDFFGFAFVEGRKIVYL